MGVTGNGIAATEASRENRRRPVYSDCETVGFEGMRLMHDAHESCNSTVEMTKLPTTRPLYENVPRSGES